MTWPAKAIIEVIAVFAMVFLPALVIWHRAKTDQKGLSSRTFQFCSIAMIAPILLIFGLEGSLDKATIGTLLGGLMGYVLGATSSPSKELE